jgi:hypothetical protein
MPISAHISDLRDTIARHPWRSIAAGVAALLVTFAVSAGHHTIWNNYVLLAQAFWGGHVWVDSPYSAIDALTYGTHQYVIEAPLPGLLMMPLVAIWGDQANQTTLAIILAGVAIGATWEVCERLGLDWRKNVWLCGFALAGTDLLWCATQGDVWFIAHVCAFAFTMLALGELFGKRRAWLVALFGACAFESRFGMVLALPVYAYLLLSDVERPFRFDPMWRRSLGGLVAVLAPVGALWVLYNQARWGTWNDVGYTLWYHHDQIGVSSRGPFGWGYLPNQLQSFFVQGPVFIGSYPWVIPKMGGQSLLWTSPALVLAFFARGQTRTIIAMWIAVVLCAAPNFLYYVNGFAQFGMRHALDFEPFLIVLIALAIRTRIPAWGYALMAYSMAVGLWGCWFWNTLSSLV